MAHILGIGTLWENVAPRATLITSSTTNPLYTGTQGNIGNVNIGGTGQAVIENTGGPGTNRGHWKESVYGFELMTGYISTNYAPMSQLTVRALTDLGYTGVDVSKVSTQPKTLVL
jgi:hypothetical protein